MCVKAEKIKETLAGSIDKKSKKGQKGLVAHQAPVYYGYHDLKNTLGIDKTELVKASV